MCAARPHSEAIRDAQRKNSKVPVHAVLTATNPIRFIGSDDMTQKTGNYFRSIKISAVASDHYALSFFTYARHCPGPRNWYILLWEDLRKTLPEIGAVPAIPQQSSLSEFATYHRQVPSAILKGVCMVSALYAVLSALLLTVLF